ncbi:RNA polymerase sigma-70 factor, ECF subfamily [Anaerosphaera aminiphila DSM 21120]|uniref:RNA polymerase sigma-70 factor, ECF subfamily n=1 Tax=Anaerosphaera aminiphila DSM 21120 TaxID=1120995 RepID=A0A1M5T1R0_9FIRM|nr:sigma-70 family RNA polymerase sigma factor [Anaerosphaera aminiphila]SHH44719.1 RNA polymerase sigma-70 factor, ECF subfamily [Anaerosphaera aminiphila DSM 21120]
MDQELSREHIQNCKEDIGKDEVTLDFISVYDEYYTKVYRYVSYRIDNKSDIEDLTSQVFLKIYSKINNYNFKKGTLPQWIFTIAGNTIRDYYRKNSIRKFLSFDSLGSEIEDSFSIEENAQQTEEYNHLKKIVKGLSKKERTLISLKYGADLSYDDIAKIMNITSNNVGVMLHRTLNKIKENMEGYYE